VFVPIITKVEDMTHGDGSGEMVVRADAPGRVNLIGEHTDYNGGFVLPMPIPQRTRVALRRRGDGGVRVSSSAEGVSPVSWKVGSEEPSGSWADYVAGVFSVARSAGLPVGGVKLWVSSDVPLGSGLSSSAALEVAVLRALRAALGWTLDDVALARLAHRAEVEFVGARVGLMDQLASSCGIDGEALLIDCRDVTLTPVPLPADAEVAVISSGIRHSNATGGYNERRAECERAAALLGVKSLREVESEADAAALPAPLHRRVRHVVSENRRVLDMVDAFAVGDLEAAGRLMGESHASLRDDYEVSVAGVDRLVATAAARGDVYGARMTGAGFGGSVVLLCHAGAAAEAARAVVEACTGVDDLRPEALVPAAKPIVTAPGRG
jgi:galactokinase